MPSYLNLLAFSLLIFRVDDPSASDISAAIEKDGSITKACDVASQATTTLDNGRLPLSVIYYGHKNYFFNSSRVANIVSRPTVSPKLCPKTFHDIFSTCVIDQNIWGGWVMSESTNRSTLDTSIAVVIELPRRGKILDVADTHSSFTNYVYPANPLPHEGSRSSSIGSLGNGPGTQFPNITTNDAGTSHTRNQAPTTTTSPSSSICASPGVQGSSTDADNTGLPGSSKDVPSSQSETTIKGASTTTEPSDSRGTGLQLPKTTTLGKGTTTEKDSDQSTEKTTSNTGEQTEKQTGVKTVREPSETTTGISGSSTPEPNSQASSVPLPAGGTVLYTTINSRVYSEPFIPTTFSRFATLASTLTTSTINSESSSVPLVIDPGGVAGAPSSRASITAGGPSQTAPPKTTRGDETTTNDDDGSSTTERGDPSSITAALPIITTSYDPEVSTVSSIVPEITGNTAIRTSHDHHGVGIFPFWKGGLECFIICPPGIDNGGIILWGMHKPGIYPHPTPQPFPNFKWPTITIHEDLKLTATEEPDDEQTSSEDDDESTTDDSQSTTAETTSKPTSSFQSSSSPSSTGSYSTAIQNYILAIESVGLDELK
ncbi:MAG: hypothetical protein L6R38_000151 [Xanthoria sp. 2 TBL-2021]|nr:MAG: hypothetical protein L6R38_000151 [Xanthoria sp. 2 TBL-2021]